MERIAVLIPCLNEEMTIEKVISDFRQVLPSADIYVYDNGSTDRTVDIAQKAGAIVGYEPSRGKGNVIRRMFREVDADVYLIVDGDDTYPADCAGKMLSLVLDNKIDMVIGDRLSTTYFAENKRTFHNVGNKIVKNLINHLFQSEIQDMMTGYRAFSRLFVKTMPVLSKGFEIETEITVHALDKNFLINEIPITYRDRPEGSQSKLRTIEDGKRVIATIYRLFKEYRPSLFFTFQAVMCWILSGIFFAPVLKEYLVTGLVPRFPTLIVSGIVALVGILLWICGILLEAVNRKHRELYELWIVQTYADQISDNKKK